MADGDPRVIQGITDINSSVGNTVSDVQYFNSNGIYAFPSDKAFATYELSELKYLPKSLFYDAATSDGVYRGLFAYYVLGGSTDRVKYHESELKKHSEKITPQYSRNPTAKQIIDTVIGSSGTPNYLNPNSPFRGQIYNVKDFIFCKYYGIIPNNRMLTLRRFAHPTLDSLRIVSNDKVGDYTISSEADATGKNTDQVIHKSQSIPNLGKLQDSSAALNTSLPVAQLVTFFGGDSGNSLSSILNISTGLNFNMETQSALKNEQTGDPGLMNTPYGDLIKAAITSGGSINGDEINAIDNFVTTLSDPDKNINKLQRALLDEAVTDEGPLSKKIFVNLNTVNQVAVRQQGFPGGTEEFSLNFHYNLSSAGEINSKLLFLDLMANVLSVGADYGQFLTPEIRIQQTSVGMGFPGGPAGYVKSITDPINYIRDVVGKMLSAGAVDKIAAQEAASTNTAKKIYDEVNSFINEDKGFNFEKTSLSKSIAVMLSDAFLKRIYYAPIMLSGYPTGEWHLTVGNPLNPIAMMGNLVCKGVKIDFSEDLGPDDFPTEMTVKITLQPGRQRHRGDWESMFNRGNGRLYLGQLISSRETTNAWVNTQGRFPNDTRGSNIYDIVRRNASTRTGTEGTPRGPG